jgi:hypothetical protein
MTFGELTVVARAGRIRNLALWRCRCSCGNEVVVSTDKLLQNKKHVCNIDGHGKKLNSHGCSKTLTYASWEKMRERCNNPKYEKYKNYGGRGITICERWNDFANFLADMDERPSLKHSIGRIDNNGNYEPTNCRWETAREQGRNKRNSVFVGADEDRVLLLDVVERLNLNRGVVYGRLKMGWSLLEALTKPVRARKRNRKRVP